MAIHAPAAEAAHLAFDVAPGPYADALIQLALQAHVSLVGAEACPGMSRGLRGAYSLRGALRRLLAGSGCDFSVSGGDTIRIGAPRKAGRLFTPAAGETRAAPPSVGELLVTATKRALPAERIGAAVSVIGGDALAATRAADAGETTGQVSGVLMTNLGPGRDKLLVRGLSDGVFTGRARSTVSTYLDDAPINYDAPDPDLRLTDVERVEIVRGPQGALYGGGALAGVYRIVTRKPDPDRYAGEFSGTYARTRGGSPSYALEGFVNAPIVHDRLALRIAGYEETQGGYLDDVALRRADVDRTLREGARGALRLNAGGDWVVDLSGAWQHLKSRDTQYTTMATMRGRANRVAEAHQNRFAEAALTIRGRLGGADLSAATTFVRHKIDFYYDASSALDLFDAADSQLGVYAEARRVRMVTQDVVLSSHGERRLSWLAGFYAAHSYEYSPSQLEALPMQGPLASLYEETRRDHLATVAAYGELSYEIAPGWTAAVGARASRVRVHTQSTIVAPPPGRSRDLDRRLDFSAVSPKLSLQHDLADRGLVYALFSTGDRPGGVNTGGLAPPSPARATFAPDRLRNYEVGLKLAPFAGRAAFQGALFYDQWRNIQTDRYLNSGLAYTANVGDAAIWGFEAEAAAQWGEHLSVKANLLLSHAEFQRPNPDVAARIADSLPGAPAASGGVLAIYRRPAIPAADLQLVAAANYVGRSRLTFDAANARSMGGYTDVRLSAGLVARRWRGELFVENPADTSADTFAYGNPFSFGQVRQATPQRPRTIGVAATATF